MTRPTGWSHTADTVVEDYREVGAAVEMGECERAVAAVQANLLRRALRNLIDNALKYGGAARVALLEEPGQVMIRIDDDGPGIPVDQQEKVFAPFFRLERSRSRDTGGTGLGLSVARTVARAHGGDVILENRPEGGLRVTLVLPEGEA